MQLRFTSFVVTYLRRDSHPLEYAHAGRAIKKMGAPSLHSHFDTSHEKMIVYKYRVIAGKRGVKKHMTYIADETMAFYAVREYIMLLFAEIG